MDLTWKDSGNYHWVVWDNSDDNNYEYALRLAANSYREGGSKFNMFTTLPNVNAPDGYEKIAVLNGGIFYKYDGNYYNQGPEVTWYYQTQQENFGVPDPARLAMGSWGNSIVLDKVDNVYGAFPLVLATPCNEDGYGEEGVNAKRSHAFIGGNGTVSYLGYVTGNDDGSTGVSGKTVVAKMTGIYGGKCAVLDGGGSTQMWYNGKRVRESTDSPYYRIIKNAIVLYRKKKDTPVPPVPPTPPEPEPQPDPVVPSVPEGRVDSDLKGVSNGRSYVLEDGELLPVNKWMAKTEGGSLADPLAIYVVDNSQPKVVMQKYNVSFNSNTGSSVADIPYYYGDTVELPTPTKASVGGYDCHFWGWYADQELTDKVDRLAKASGDRVYYAKWLQYKMQYKGNYTGTTEEEIPFTDTDSSINTAARSFWCRTTAADTFTVTYVQADFDCCTSTWTNYVKPRFAFVKFDSPGSSSYTIIADNLQDGEWYGRAQINAGEQYGLVCFGDTGSGRTKTFFYGAKMKKEAGSSGSVDWQDSPNPPSGSWSAGYPEKRYVTRYYNNG